MEGVGPGEDACLLRGEAGRPTDGRAGVDGVAAQNILLTAYTGGGMFCRVSLIPVYKCLCDERRLRMLNLLRAGPLCVCHLQELLGLDQVEVSKQLAYMRRIGMVQARREGTWMIYRLPEPLNRIVEENLRCLQDCATEYPVFRDDLRRRAALVSRVAAAAGAPAEVSGGGCCGAPADAVSSLPLSP